MPVNITGQGNTFELTGNGVRLGHVQVRRNEFHARNVYLDFDMKLFDNTVAAELFRLLHRHFDAPLQVNLSPDEYELVSFLMAGGFRRVRRCYDVCITEEELLPGDFATAELRELSRGSAEYTDCCRRLYEYYAQTHKAVNPLTAGFKKFCGNIPGQATVSGNGRHFAFLDGDEIAYVCSDDVASFGSFGHALVSKMFQKYSKISFECDDCDEAAMALRRLFEYKEDECWDTYVYK